jgi:hypothetical protein
LPASSDRPEQRFYVVSLARRTLSLLLAADLGLSGKDSQCRMALLQIGVFDIHEKSGENFRVAVYAECKRRELQ